jgi:hypothetical protein
MASWADFETDEAELAESVASRLHGHPGYLATVDDRGAPRVHPVTPIIGDGFLFVFMEPTSPKGRDLRERHSYALHNGVGDNSGSSGECALRGNAVPVDDPGVRRTAQAASPYPPADRYVLFMLGIEEVVVTEYGDHGPRRRRWASGGIGP